MKKNANSVKGILLILLTAFLTSIGQFIWKCASLVHGPEKILLTLLGFAIFFSDGFLMVYAYRFGELSVLQPILSIGFVFSLILGKIFFNEVQSAFKYIGIAFILAGVFLLAHAGRKNRLEAEKQEDEK